MHSSTGHEAYADQIVAHHLEGTVACSMLEQLHDTMSRCPQKQLHSMYMDYFEGDPSTRTPPIPTVFMDPPGSKAGDHPIHTLSHMN